MSQEALKVDMARVVLVKSVTTGRACAKKLFRILKETDKNYVLVETTADGTPKGIGALDQSVFRKTSCFVLENVEAANDVLEKSESYYQMYLEAERRVEDYAEELHKKFTPGVN